MKTEKKRYVDQNKQWVNKTPAKTKAKQQKAWTALTKRGK